MTSDRTSGENLYLQHSARGCVVVLGEVLWDMFPHARRLGGAALNFGVHARRLGHDVYLLSAVGADELGREAGENIAALQLDTTFLQTTAMFPTGTATVELTPDGGASFRIRRPAAYDALEISPHEVECIKGKAPGWLYYGTLFASTRQGRSVLERLVSSLVEAVKFYDLNLRPDSYSAELVDQLLHLANVVKLNEEELHRVQEYTGLPLSVEAFCHEAAALYGWKAVAVTLGTRGCAILANGNYVEAAGNPIEVADTVGAGDAFAAAFMHGLSSNWPLAEVAAFSNRVGALVASRHGAIPEWTLEEAVKG